MSENNLTNNRIDKIKIGIVEDDSSTRYYLEKVIRRENSIEIVGSWPNAECCLEEANFDILDVVLIDLQLPGMSGIELIKKIKRKSRETACVILTASQSNSDIHACLKLGATGYITKDSSPKELVLALTNISLNGISLSRTIAGQLVADLFTKAPKIRVNENTTASLTDRERHILSLLTDGKHPKEIALDSHLSYETVRGHLKRAFLKLKVNSQKEAIRKFLELGG